MSNFYTGSHLFAPLVDYVGLSVDKINFIVCQLAAIGLGSIFQTYFPSSPGQNNSHRYISSTIIGIALCVFCFGYQIIHLVMQCAICLGILYFVDLAKARYIVCAVAFIYLSVCHMLRQYFDYGGYTLDITGPLMIMTQRLSCLAFNIHDGEIYAKDKSKLTVAQRKHHIKKFPSMLELASYFFHFQGIILGPFIFFSDFKNFMEGTWPNVEDDPNFSPEVMEKLSKNPGLYLGAQKRIFTSFAMLLFYMFCVLVLAPNYPVEFVKESTYINDYSFLSKVIYMTFACFLIRQKYYFAWTMAEISYMRSGFGFSGFDSKTGEPEYKMIQNFDFLKVETGTSMKVLLDNWNISTTLWLRECIYERFPAKYATFAVFAASAFWHGFYPGYYLLFVSAAFLTQIARNVRRKVRPHFQVSTTTAFVYDVITGIAAMTTLNYGATAFALLELSAAFNFWRCVFFFVHAFGLLIHIALKFVPRAPTSS